MDIQDHFQRHAWMGRNSEEEEQDRVDGSQMDVAVKTEPQVETTMVTDASPLPLEPRIQEFMRLRNQIQLVRSKRIQEWVEASRAATTYVSLGQEIVDLEKQTAAMLSELLLLLPSGEPSSTSIMCRVTELLGEDVRENHVPREIQLKQLLRSMMPSCG
jgi:hypothetical protein